MADFYDKIVPGAKDDVYTFRVEVRDGHANYLGDVGDYLELEVAWSSEAEDLDASNLIIPTTSPWTKTFMRANTRVTLVHILLYRNGKVIRKWTGRIDRSIRKMQGKQGTVSAELISDKAWFNHIICWSAPRSALWVQAPKRLVKVGPAITTMKNIAIDNVNRYQARMGGFRFPGGAGGGRGSGGGILGRLFGRRDKEPPQMPDWMQSGGPRSDLFGRRASTYDRRFTVGYDTFGNGPITIVPGHIGGDNSPTTAFVVQMTPVSELWGEVCKDYHLLPTAEMFIPGRDPMPEGVSVSKPTVVIDVRDKDRARARAYRPNVFRSITKELGVFIRGLFGRFDAPSTIDTYNIDNLLDYFGRRQDDPWVIFRTSDEHWYEYEICSYAPTTTTSIAGGKAHDFLNKGINFLANAAIKGIFSLIGLGFVGDILTGQLDDILFAYQQADDPALRRYLGPFAFYEDFGGQGTTAYSFDSAQKLRQARYQALGYKTASFTGDSASFPPFRIFEDFDLLDPVGWEDPDEGRIIPERIKQITARDNRQDGVQFSVRLGELDRPEEPWAIQMRQNARFKKAINAALNAD